MEFDIVEKYWKDWSMMCIFSYLARNLNLDAMFLYQKLKDKEQLTKFIVGYGNR